MIEPFVSVSVSGRELNSATHIMMMLQKSKMRTTTTPKMQNKCKNTPFAQQQSYWVEINC